MRIETDDDSDALMDDYGIGDEYIDIPGLCKVATVDEIEDQGWSLNPGRYVGVAEGAADDFDFKERLQELNEELEVLNEEAMKLAKTDQKESNGVGGMSWPKKPLANVADFCLGKMLDKKKNKGRSLPYLANVNVRWGSFDFDNLRLIEI